MKFNIFAMLCAGLTVAPVCAAPIATTSTSIQPISQYGLIQNVQNYSSNPFWNPSGPYNQRMPQAIYAQGADLNTADCQRTVGTLVASYCVNNNDCIGMQLSDVRPAIMLQLARLPGHNYATSCAGFIDSEFDDYLTRYTNAGPSNVTTPFPSGTVANPAINETEFKIDNPYQIKNRTWNNEEWEKEKKERYNELQELQSMNGPGYETLARADFPFTTGDLSFSDEVTLKSAGYEAYKDASPYAKPFEIESESAARARQQTAHNDYCKRYPNDLVRCPELAKKKDPKEQECEDLLAKALNGNEVSKVWLREKCPGTFCNAFPDDDVEYCRRSREGDDPVDPAKPEGEKGEKELPKPGNVIELVLEWRPEP